MTEAPDLTRALGGHWYGTYGKAPCPVCQAERLPGKTGLTLAAGADGRLLLHCKKSGCAFRDILGAAGVACGRLQPLDPALVARRERERASKELLRGVQARRVWDETQGLKGTIAERYLRGRGITCPLAATLRFHVACWHPSGRRLPALVALVEGGSGFGVHRTYLNSGGPGKAAITPQKAMLGCITGGAVRVSAPSELLVVAEGIETALSLASGLLTVPATIWAALSTSGLRGLRLPHQPGRLKIAVDGDTPGHEAAEALAKRADRLGWEVDLLNAPDGQDWNDVLLQHPGEAAV